jgi:hypothetical protein
MDKPVERGFQCFDRVILPSDQGYVKLTAGQSAIFGAEHVSKAAPAQLS